MVIKHLELFSGIGGFRRAIELLCHDFDMQSLNIGFSEIDANAISTYKANFETGQDIQIGDIVSFVGKKANIKKLPSFHLLTGGFPCQAFSLMGRQKGFDDVRGNVFFHILEILKVKEPKFVLLENVKNLVTHNKGNTFRTIIQCLHDAGYKYVSYDAFNSKDFMLAQNRNRIFIFASNIEVNFNAQKVIEAFNAASQKVSLLKQQTTADVLEMEVDSKYYLSDIIKPTILADGSKNFKSKSEINQLIARPLTATMSKMHRACQDNYFSDDFIQATDKHEFAGKVFTKDELEKKRIRRITPKEAFNLQGFDDTFYNNAKKTMISDSQLYKQAGNAVSVNTVYAIMHYLLVENNILER